MADECKLKLANDIAGESCNEEQCVYWRVAEHIGLNEVDGSCAIQHFQLLDGGTDVAAWLLSVKERLERVEAEK